MVEELDALIELDSITLVVMPEDDEEDEDDSWGDFLLLDDART